MAAGACTTDRTWPVATRQMARATEVSKRHFRRAGIPHPPRDSRPLPSQRKKVQKGTKADMSGANRPGHLDVLTIAIQKALDRISGSLYLTCWLNTKCQQTNSLPLSPPLLSPLAAPFLRT